MSSEKLKEAKETNALLEERIRYLQNRINLVREDEQKIKQDYEKKREEAGRFFDAERLVLLKRLDEVKARYEEKMKKMKMDETNHSIVPMDVDSNILGVSVPATFDLNATSPTQQCEIEHQKVSKSYPAGTPISCRTRTRMHHANGDCCPLPR